MKYVDGIGMDGMGMVIIGLRSSESTFKKTGTSHGHGLLEIPDK